MVQVPLPPPLFEASTPEQAPQLRDAHSKLHTQDESKAIQRCESSLKREMRERDNATKNIVEAPLILV